MKKILVLGLFYMTCCACLAQTSAQEETPAPEQKNVISLYPFPFIGDSFVIGYERRISQSNALKLIGGLTLTERSELYDLNNLEEYYLELQFRHYLNQKGKESKAIEGAYMAPYALFKSYKGDTDRSMVTTKLKSSAGGLGMVIGYQFITRPGISLDAYIGGGLIFSNGNTKDNGRTDIVVNTYRRGTALQIGLNLGFGF